MLTYDNDNILLQVCYNITNYLEIAFGKIGKPG